MQWSGATQADVAESSLLRRGAGLLIPPLWVEDAKASFNYVTSTQLLHPDDAEQPTCPSLPGPNGERSLSVWPTTGALLEQGWARLVWPRGSQPAAFALHPNYAQQLASGVCPSHLNHCGIGSQCLSFHYCPLRSLPGCACRSQAGPGSPRRYEPLGKRTREVTGGTQDWIQAKAALQTEVQTLRHCCGACSGHQASAD